MFLSKAEVRPLSGTCQLRTFRDIGSCSISQKAGSVFERKPLLEPAKACRNPDRLKSEGHAAA